MSSKTNSAIPKPQLAVMVAGLAAVGVGLQALLGELAEQLSASQQTLAQAIIGLFLVGFAANATVFFLTRGKDELAAWSRYIISVDWLAQLLILSLLWALGSTIDAGARNALILAPGMALIPLSVMVSIRPQAQRPLPLTGQIGSLVFPLGAIAYLLVHPQLFGGSMILLIALIFALSMAAKQVLIAQLDEADDALRGEQELKARFLASASHDLEQPLQSARLSLYHAQQHDDPSVRGNAFRRMDLAFAAMESMVTQITGHLRLDGGRIEVTNTAVALAGPIGRVVALQEAQARLAEVELRTSPTALEAVGDAELIGRILANFIANAVRHAKARRILVAARRHGDRVRLWVIDDGEGVAEADRARLFDDFFQGDHNGEIRGGYGLGLGSARRMARLMGASVGLDPRWRGGSAFFLELSMP